MMMPVPRRSSASCGTCVKFSMAFDPAMADEDLDAVYAVEGAGSTACYSRTKRNKPDTKRLPAPQFCGTRRPFVCRRLACLQGKQIVNIHKILLIF